MDEERRLSRLLDGPAVFLPWVAVLVAVAPAILLGFPGGHDWIYELTRIAEWSHAAGSGQVPPYWAENLYGGYGSPAYLFYAPLHAAIAALFSALFGSVATGAVIAIVFFTIMGLFSTRLLLRAVFTADPEPAPLARTAVRVGTVAFLLNPYLICNTMLRNANAEYAALCLLPLPLAGVVYLGRNRRLGVALIASGLALCVLAHNLTGLTCAVLLVLWAVILYVPREGSKLIPFAGATALGLMISGFFWIPALGLKGLMRMEDLQVGLFDFRSQFFPPWVLFGYARFFAAGILPFALIVGAAVWMLLRRRARRPVHGSRVAIAVLVTACGSLFLQTRLSSFLWETIPFLPLFQFPWRFMGPFALASALAAGLLVVHLKNVPGKKTVIVAEVLFLVLCVANALPHLLEAEPIPADLQPQLSEMLSPDGVRRMELRVTIRDEYLPRGADPTAWRTHPLREGTVVNADPHLQLRVIRNEATSIDLETRGDTAGRIRIGRWFFPGWELRINGEEREVHPNEVGSIDVELPAGTSTVRLELKAPRIRRAGIWISILGVALLGLFVGRR